MHPSRRTLVITESVIREMTRVCNQHGAINLAQGFPDFPIPTELKQAAVSAVLNDCNQYSITWGSARLRQAVAHKTYEFYGLQVDPDKHVTITCGATEAITCTLMAILDPGDELIVFEPFYENYVPAAILAGAKPVLVPFHSPDFAIDFDQLRAAFSRKTKAIIINTPNNPTGKVFTHDELTHIANLCREHAAVVVTDEIYEHIVYDGLKHTPMAALPNMFDTTITCNSVSKSYGATGWRVGYVITSQLITEAIRKVHDFVTVGAPAPLQEAAIVAFDLPRSYYDQLAKDYQSRRDLFLGYLEDAGLPYTKPLGAYYVMTDISRLGFENDVEAAVWLAKEIGVAGVPGSSFFGDSDKGKHLMRFHFSKLTETLHEAGRRLCTLCT